MMFRNILDVLLDYKATHVISVVAQLGILLWATVWRGGTKPILVVNLIIAGAVLLYNATRLPTAIEYQEYPLIGLMLFELAAFVASAGALYGFRIPSWLLWIAFSVNFLLCIALMLLILTFRMTRLF
jgi:hypothetical protein